MVTRVASATTFEGVDGLDAALSRVALGVGVLQLGLAEGLEALGQCGGHQELGFASLEAYGLERCERSARWVQAARALARRVAGLPALRRAAVTGEVGFCMAQVIAGVACAQDEEWWLAEARVRTVQKMRALVKMRAENPSPPNDPPAAPDGQINRVVVRFNRAIPAGAEFDAVAFEGTYCNAVNSTNLVVYRRPLPTTNFGALGTVLWDGLGNAIAATPHDAIGLVAIGATQLHAQTTFLPSPEQVAEMVGVMESLTTAQTFDRSAKALTARDALGGPEKLASLPLTGSPGFTIYDAWENVPGGGTEAARRSVARGQAIFDSRPIQITGVGGLADRTGTCAGCHRVPNMGNSAGLSVLDIGTSDASRRPADLPLYTLRKIATGETVQSSDPGRALVTGAWADIGKFKVPNLRALAARAPYFHNGMAATLDDVVAFYDSRFSMGLSAQDAADLANFLRAL